MHRVIWILAALLAVAPFGCKKSAPPEGAAAAAPSAAAPTPGAPAPAAASAEAAEPATPAHPDPGATLEMKSGTVSAKQAAPVELRATARMVADGHTWLRAELPDGPDVPDVYRGNDTPRIGFWTKVRGGRHGVAALQAIEGGPRRQVFVRLVGESLPERLEIDLYEVERDSWQAEDDLAWDGGRLVVTGAAAAPEASDVRAGFVRAFAQQLEEWGRGDGWRVRPFYAFANHRLLAAADPARPFDPAVAPARQSEIGELMSLYTGAASVDEALQADRGLRLRATPADQRTIPIGEVAGVPLAAHPWAEMQADLGREPAVEPLARSVPQDVLYLHFPDLRVAVRVMDDLDDWVVPASRLLENRPGTTHLVDRYQEQLVVDRTGLAKRLGHLAADGVAFVAGDPFLREGSDVAVLFHVKQEELLTSALAWYEARSREKHADLAESTYEVGAHTVRLLSTPDGAVAQHRVKLDGVLVVANSRALVERLVAVADGKTPPLADAGDFRYMRTLYPYAPGDAKTESAFAFVSDAFVAHAVSPAAKIGAARRMEARGDLMAVASAALLHGWLEGRLPKDAAELVASGLLAENELKHADGSPIHYDAQRGVWSERWGRPTMLRPLAEVPVTAVTEAEKAAYDAFRNTYQSYWRTYIDPIAARVGRSDDGRRITLDARMLPLIDSSDYDDLIEKVGTARMRPPQLHEAVQWTFAVGKDARLRREMDQLAHMAGDIGVNFGWLGDWVMLGAVGRGALWDLALLGGEIPEAERRPRSFGDEKTSLAVASRLPIYIGAQVRNPLNLAASLTALRSAASAAAPGLFDWGEVGRYRDVPIVAIRAKEGIVPRMEGVSQVALHYATAKDVFLASLSRDVLEMQIDAVLDGRGATAVAEGTPDGAPAGTPDGLVQSEVRVTIDEPEGWLVRTVLGLLEREARSALDTAYIDLEALARGLGGLPTEPDAFRAAALAWLGYEPRSVQGGAFSTGPDGLLRHERYGSVAAPHFPKLPIEGAPLTELVESLKTLAMGVAFEGEGRTRGLRVQFEWSRR